MNTSNLDKLIKANLYRAELIPISGKLVDRYNQCLKKMGIAPTVLPSFSIDGIGWSPEIAAEKKSPMYLNSGEANPHGILISPQQKGKPIYMPFHSFDKMMMEMVFTRYESQISNITRDSAICLDFDQGIDTFYGPLDVLKYQEVKISFHDIKDLKKIRKEQMALIDQFMLGTNFIDEELHGKILDSARTHGDLRERNIGLEPLVFQCNTFYTKAFKGIFVLRDFILPILVFEDMEVYKLAIKDTEHDVLMYHIDQPELMEKLRDHMLIECDLKRVVNTAQYERVKKFIFAELLKERTHPLNQILEEPLLLKRYLNTLSIEDRKRVMGVELYLEKLETSNQYKKEDLIDLDFYNALHQPHSSIELVYETLIWQLLVKISTKDILHLYWYGKEQFYEQYRSWEEDMKDWSIETITNALH
ncbi:hypothetical protein MWU59_08345 [Flavobacteriaceae bacterium F08102]|nr:hypothetical protein [Flavobacteriaceae bacterium F08102]